MEPDEIDKIWKSFNEPHLEADYPSEQSFALSKLGNHFKETNDTKKEESIRSEFNLFNRIVGFHGEVTNIWEWCGENIGKPFPNWKKEDVPYYKKRFQETTDTLNKARYAYAIWTLEKSDIEYAHKAIENFLQTGHRYGQIDDLDVFPASTMTMCYRMALKLSLSISAPSPLDPKTVLPSMFETLTKQNSVGGKHAIVGWIIDLISELSSELLSSKQFKEDKDICKILEDTRQITKSWSEHFSKEKKFEGKDAYLKREAKIYHALGDNENEKKVKKSIAESLIERAEIMKGDNLLHSHFLEMAAKVYNDMGETEKVKELGAKAQEAIRQAFEGGEFKEVSTTVSIPTVKIVDNYLKKLTGLSPDELIEAIICDDTNLIPNLEKVKNTVSRLEKQYPLSHLLPRMEYDDAALPSRVVEEGPQKTEIEINKQFQMDSGLRLTILNELFSRLFPSIISKNALLSWLKKSKNIDSDDSELISKGFDYYFGKDFTGFCHVVMPRIEQEIRALLKLLGGSTIAYDPKDIGFDQKVLGGLIRDLKPFIDENLHKFLEVWFTQEGVNLRNKISHGWLKPKKFNEHLSDLLLYTLLRLAKIKKPDTESVE